MVQKTGCDQETGCTQVDETHHRKFLHPFPEAFSLLGISIRDSPIRLRNMLRCGRWQQLYEAIDPKKTHVILRVFSSL